MEREFIHMVNRYVGERLKELRIQRGLTQADLGQALNLTFQQIQKYEKGRNKINAGRLYHLAHVLEVSPMYFFEGLDTWDTAGLPEGREEWLKLAAAAAALRNAKLREALKALIQDARKLERALYGGDREEHRTE